MNYIYVYSSITLSKFKSQIVIDFFSVVAAIIVWVACLCYKIPLRSQKLLQYHRVSLKLDINRENSSGAYKILNTNLF